jgi:hypothetical protein
MRPAQTDRYVCGRSSPAPARSGYSAVQCAAVFAWAAASEVLYGGEIVVSTDIMGGKLDAPVRCLTRDPISGRTEDSPAFREDAGRFSRKLEKVAAPVEVAFAVGRARSAWLPISVLMQPKVQRCS